LSTDLSSETRKLEYEVSPDKRVDCVDLTRDFLEHACVERVHYQEMPHCLYYLLVGNALLQAPATFFSIFGTGARVPGPDSVTYLKI
jgi:hypothetical protein